jgi:uncharacterized protein (DUF362 family)
VSDLRVIRELVRWLVEDGRAARITIAEGAGGWKPAALDGWSTDWNGEFDGLTYRGIAREFGIELLDLNFAESVNWIRSGRSYRLARAVRDCDCLISHSPLKTNVGTGVSLSIKNLFGIAPGSVYGFPKFGLHAVGPLDEVAVDLLEFRPDTYAILGGPWGIEAEADTPVEHSVLLCGSSAVAVDTVAAAVMGFDAEELDFLPLAARRGLGSCRLRRIRVEGDRIEEARRPFRRPAQWEVACR